MSSVVSLRTAPGSYLMQVSYYRLPDGRIQAVLDDMPAPVIDAEADISSRLLRASRWCLQGMLSFARQADHFKERPLAASNDKDQE